MNAAKIMTSKWTLMLGAAVLMAVMANTALADPPRHGGGDGYRDGRGGYVDRDRGRDRDGDRWRGGSSWRGGYGGYGGYAYPVYVGRPVYYPPVYPAYYGSACVVGGYYGGAGITIIIR